MEELMTKVRSAFEAAFNIDPQNITIETTVNEIPAWDSLGHVTLASCLERSFGLTFDVDDLMEMESVKDICRVVQSKLSREQGVQVQ